MRHMFDTLNGIARRESRLLYSQQNWDIWVVINPATIQNFDSAKNRVWEETIENELWTSYQYGTWPSNISGAAHTVAPNLRYHSLSLGISDVNRLDVSRISHMAME